MVDPISNAPSSRQIGPAQRRSRASSGSAQIARDSVQRVEALQAAVEKLIKRNPSETSQISEPFRIEEGSAVHPTRKIGARRQRQWPPAQLLKLRHYLKQMDGLLVDTEV